MKVSIENFFHSGSCGIAHGAIRINHMIIEHDTTGAVARRAA